MPITSFRPELHGERFANHEVPLEVLRDFAAFGEMLIEVAKREYLDDHPGRLRIPRGFTKGVEIRLAGIEEGSAILPLVVAGLSIADESVYIRRAHDKIVSTITKVESGQRPELPPELLRYFDRFGRSLLDGERISFRRTDNGAQSNLTKDVREKLLRASEAEEWSEEALLKGRVSAADVADGEFELALLNGTKLKAPLEEQHRKTALEALGAYQDKRMVAVKAVLTTDKHGHPKRVNSVEHMTLLDPLDVETRLDELAKLRDRWLNGQGVALDKAGLKALADAFEQHFDPELPLPYIYPTPEGGVLAEWKLGQWAVSLDIALPSQTAEYQALNLSSDQAMDDDFNLSESQGWETLNRVLKELSLAATTE